MVTRRQGGLLYMFLDPCPMMPLVPFLDFIMVVLTPSCMVDVCVCVFSKGGHVCLREYRLIHSSSLCGRGGRVRRCECGFIHLDRQLQ